MDNKKNTKFDAVRRRKTGGSRCFKKRSLIRETVRYAKNNNLTSISSNTTEHQVSSAKKLRKSSIHIENSKQSSYLHINIFSQIIYYITLLVNVHLVKARIYHLLSTQ